VSLWLHITSMAMPIPDVYWLSIPLGRGTVRCSPEAVAVFLWLHITLMAVPIPDVYWLSIPLRRGTQKCSTEAVALSLLTTHYINAEPIPYVNCLNISSRATLQGEVMTGDDSVFIIAPFSNGSAYTRCKLS
jgi:hypothetical protein